MRQNGRMIERRKFVRLTLDADVKCKIENLAEGLTESVKCHNISPEGLCITSKKRLKEGTPIHIEVGIKDQKPFAIKGEVVWIKEEQGELRQPEFRTGIKILEVKSGRDRFLLQLCDEMLGKLSRKYPKMKF